MKLSAKEAAAQVGISKQAIIRAIHKGKLSATRNASGEFEIEPVELFRAYQPLAIEASTTVTQVDGSETPSQSEALSVRVEMLERMIRDKDETIADLSTKLDAAIGGMQKVSLLLEDKQRQEKRGWWQRLFGN